MTILRCRIFLLLAFAGAMPVLLSDFQLFKLTNIVVYAIALLGDHRLGAQAMGVHTTFYKTLTFGISTMYTGIAGALSAMALLYAAPAGIFVSLGFLIGSAIGGIATLSGAIYGAIFLQVILLTAGTVAESAKTPAVLAVYGIVVIAFLHLMPTGVAGLVEKVAARMRKS